ncbi:NAD(P)-binding domain protein [Apiospora hydei]|uniref:NAD(P)-binding domain protein n=1 Tax=Apiospora hydei TaxID=1337664 RepID=A0ABR1X877_9PEZI
MGFLRSQLIETRKLPYPSASYAGQTIVITGSNTGLGKEAARHYARLGASRLILAVRNLEKGHAARKDIQTTAAKGTAIDVWELDMAKYSSVQAFAARLDAELNRVDIFHANAGVVCPKYSVTEGNETSVTINYVSTFLLAALVLPKLKATAAQFIPHMSAASTAIKNGGLGASDGAILAAVNDPHFAGGAHWKEQYPVSKLLGVFAVRSIAKERPADAYPVTVNMVSPGLCHSELSREAEGCRRWRRGGAHDGGGSRTLVDAGVQGAKSHGQYLADCRIAQPSAVVLDNPDVQDRLWVELKAKLEAIQPGVTDNF